MVSWVTTIFQCLRKLWRPCRPEEPQEYLKCVSCKSFTCLNCRNQCNSHKSLPVHPLCCQPEVEELQVSQRLPYFYNGNAYNWEDSLDAETNPIWVLSTHIFLAIAVTTFTTASEDIAEDIKASQSVGPSTAITAISVSGTGLGSSYLVVNFLQGIHERHPIAHELWDFFVSLKSVWSFTVVFVFILCAIWYHIGPWYI